MTCKPGMKGVKEPALGGAVLEGGNSPTSRNSLSYGHRRGPGVLMKLMCLEAGQSGREMKCWR